MTAYYEIIQMEIFFLAVFNAIRMHCRSNFIIMTVLKLVTLLGQRCMNLKHFILQFYPQLAILTPLHFLRLQITFCIYFSFLDYLAAISRGFGATTRNYGRMNDTYQIWQNFIKIKTINFSNSKKISKI